VALVAALQRSLSAFGGRTAVRRNGRCFAAANALHAIVAAMLLAGALAVATTAPSFAQGFTYNARPPHPTPPAVAHDGQMLVQAVEVDYDYNKQPRLGGRQCAAVLQRHQRRSRQG